MHFATSFQQIVEATARIRSVFPPTAVTASTALAEGFYGLNRASGKEIYLKWDNKLHTGSFKERGAINALSQLTDEAKKLGVCAASAGNHALALSYHAARMKIACRIVMPVGAPLVKLKATRATGAHVDLHGQNLDAALAYASKLSDDMGLTFIPPFNHPDIIAGQGSAGIEILEQVPDFDTVVVPVGGGGLISGIALAIKEKRPNVKIIGVQSEWAMLSREKGGEKQHLIPPATIADGIAVKRIGSLTGPIIKHYVDELITVTESQIAYGIVRLLEQERTVVEGAGAAAVAALLAGLLPPSTKKAVFMVCGSNIDMNILSRLIEREMDERGRLLRIVASVPDRPGSLHATTGLIAAEHANILQVLHDRSSSHNPGNVDITFLMEVKDRDHADKVQKTLEDAGLEIKEV